jgi:hypothetical protein
VKVLTAGWYRLVGRLFGRTEVTDTVATCIRIDASPQAVWDQVMFYEEVPQRPSFLLRLLLPSPLRTRGDKTRLGATVQCEYEGGSLEKRIDTVESPHFLAFHVVEQRLGIERCIQTVAGSYRISSHGHASDVVLTTTYHTRLHPRALWRPVETFVATRVHKHILRGVDAATRSRAASIRGAETHAEVVARTSGAVS